MLEATGPRGERAYERGHLVLTPATALPADARELPRAGTALALGAERGREHLVFSEAVALHEAAGGAARFLVIGGNRAVAVHHADHAPLLVPPGVYRLDGIRAATTRSEPPMPRSRRAPLARTSVAVPPEMLELLRSEARRSRTSVSDVVRRAVEAHLATTSGVVSCFRARRRVRPVRARRPP